MDKLITLDPESPPSDRSGAKFINLSHLVRLKAPVPPAFLIPAALDFKQLSDSWYIHAIEAIGGFPVVVRSSATNEDGLTESFAGYYDSKLNVLNIIDLRAAIEAVRFSRPPRQEVYQSLKAEAISPIPVFVQKQISPLFAGVLFTLNPVNGREEEVLIEYCEGLGNQLMAGSVTPNSSFVHRRTGLILRTEGMMDQALSESHVQQLLRLAKSLERSFGYPVDIEWCIDQSNQVWLVQARPITRIHSSRSDGSWLQWPLTAVGPQHFLSPFIYTIEADCADRAINKWLLDLNLRTPRDPILMELTTYCYGRMYWNLEMVKPYLEKLPFFSEKGWYEVLNLPREKDLNLDSSLITNVSLLSHWKKLKKKINGPAPWEQKLLEYRQTFPGEVQGCSQKHQNLSKALYAPESLDSSILAKLLNEVVTIFGDLRQTFYLGQWYLLVLRLNAAAKPNEFSTKWRPVESDLLNAQQKIQSLTNEMYSLLKELLLKIGRHLKIDQLFTITDHVFYLPHTIYGDGLSGKLNPSQIEGAYNEALDRYARFQRFHAPSSLNN